jgi:DNA-binding FadR family transcriptional regulator
VALPLLPARAPAPAKRPTIPGHIATQIRRAILVGDYGPGEVLPPERVLAGAMDINRNPRREAMRVLEEAGLVRAMQGQGVRVRDFRKDGQLRLVADFVLESGLPGAERLAVLVDTLRARSVFLGEAASWAAERRTDEDVARLRALAERELAAETDLAMQRAIIEAAHSLVAVWTFNTFAALASKMAQALPSLWVIPPRYHETITAVIDAVERRDAEGARKAQCDHLSASDAAVGKALASIAAERAR